MSETLVVNFYGGPACGKTTFATGVYAELKRRHYNVEYAPEFPRELVFDGFKGEGGLLDNQIFVFAEQYRRIARLLGQTDIVVTDSPIILSAIYDKKQSPELRNLVLAEYRKMNNVDLVVVRNGGAFLEAGRRHSQEESKLIDIKISQFLTQNGLAFGEVFHSDTFSQIADTVEARLRSILTK